METMQFLSQKFKGLIELPRGELEDEWIAFNLFEISEFTSLFAKLLAQVCSCQQMTAGAGYEYMWTTSEQQSSIPASEYVQKVLDFVQQQMSDQKLFPIEPGVPFPRGFKHVASQILRRILRVYIHAYLDHQPMLDQLEIREQFCQCLIFVLKFGKKFELLGNADFEPIQLFVNQWKI
ncbi:Mob1/phocein_family protein [Hexamita inflata]|uniref:Mob1/phocein family protein n=1 Tax=Hexamita inflata TaxID=28002 RepID=A0AA86QSU9_9EUKA|nr:Mob1/phocein family protein [Hexamita inflata]